MHASDDHGVAYVPAGWALLALAVFMVGTEIRVRADEPLAASRYREQLAEDQRRVPAYVPFVR